MEGTLEEVFHLQHPKNEISDKNAKTLPVIYKKRINCGVDRH